MPLPFKEPEDTKLDDVMLAMDVVDTLRHERMLITRDINSEVRRESLVDRLREIYRGQGITVPDDILMDGVKALEEERFRYQPPREGLGTRLARIYINRGRWLPLVVGLLALFGLASTVNYFGFERPAAQEQARIERVLSATPAALETALAEALGTDPAAAVRDRAEDLYQDGLSAVEAGNVAGAETALSQLGALATQLDLAYNLEIVQPGSGELSANTYQSARGDTIYLAVVNALDATGAPVPVEVTDAITNRTADVSTFGVQIDQSVYERIARDLDDGRIDQNVLGQKARGELEVELSPEVGNLRFLEWR